MIVERNIRNRRVRAECAEAYSRLAAHVLDVFERLSASGTSLTHGTQIRFGWSLLRLVEEGDALRIMEPDFVRWPEQHWSPTIDITLKILIEQTSLLHRLGVDGMDAFFDQAIIAAPGALAQPNIFLRRTSSISSEDSGWLLATLEDPEALASDDGLESVLIASLLGHRPALLQALTLPTGFIVLFSSDALEKVFDASGRVRFPPDAEAAPSLSQRQGDEGTDQVIK